MVKKHKTVQVAQGKRGLSKREVAFALVGSKTAQKSVVRWATAPNKRVYSTKRLVWMCEDCAGFKSEYTKKLEREAQEAARAEALAQAEAERIKNLEQFRKEKIKINRRKDTLTTKLNNLRIEKGKIEKTLLVKQRPLIDDFFEALGADLENKADQIYAEEGMSEFLMMGRHVAEDPTVDKKYQGRIKNIVSRLNGSQKIKEQLRISATPTFDPERPLELGRPLLEEQRGAIRSPGDIFRNASNSLFIRLNRVVAYLSLSVFIPIFLLGLLANLSSPEVDESNLIVLVALLFLIYPYLLIIRYLHSFNVRRQLEARKMYKKIFKRIKEDGIALFNSQASKTEAKAELVLSGAISEINDLTSQFSEKKKGIANVLNAISLADEELKEIASNIDNNSRSLV